MVDAPSIRSPVLRGRAPQQAAISALLARTAEGSGGALLGYGARGLGRTALLDYAAGTAERYARPGFTVLCSAGQLDEARLPYAGLHRLLHPLRDLLDELPPGPARALTRALDEGLDEGLDAHPDVGRDTDRHADRDTGQHADRDTDRDGAWSEGRNSGLARVPVAAATLRLLGVASRRAPLLCCVDDVDQLDTGSLATIAFVARRLTGQRTALLMTSRTEAPVRGVPALRLTALSERDGRALARDLLPGSPPVVTERLCQLATGNPRALVELADSLDPDQRAGTAPLPDGLPADSRLRAAYNEQLRQLPAATRWLVVLAAAAGGGDLDRLARAAATSAVDIAKLDPAERHGLIRVGDTAVSFPQPLTARLLYESAPLDARRQAHRCLAEAAASAGDYRQAAAEMTRAARLSHHPAEHSRWTVGAARYAWQSGDLEQARQLLRRVPHADTPADVDGERRLLRGEIELRTGAATAAIGSLVSAAGTLASHRPGLAIDALLRATEPAWFAGDHRRYPEMVALATRLTRPESTVAEQQKLAYVVGVGGFFHGRTRPAVASLRRVVTLGEQLGDLVALVLAAAASLLLADFPNARRLAAEAVGTARGCGYASALPLALELLADAEYGLGRYDDADHSCRAGLRASEDTGQEIYAADHRAMLAVLAAVRGEADTSRRWLDGLAVPAGAGPMSRPVALRQWALAVGDLTAGRPGGAADRLLSIGDPATGDGQVLIQILAAPWLVEAAAHADPRRQRAAEVLVLYRRWAESTGAPVPRALSARCRALLAARGSTESVALFTESLRLHGLGECDFELARTELLFGQELRRRRRPRDAREHLRRAHETFARLSLTGWADRAATELRAAGEQVACRATALTAQQLAVARLVAGGATNREVAAKLFISPRTVDHHLRNIFHRLGIRSRVELARLLS